MEWWAWLGCCAVGVVAGDRLGVWAEKRGWIYWRRRGRGGMSEATFGPLFEAFQPTHHYVVEERERRRLVVQQSGRGATENNDAAELP